MAKRKRLTPARADYLGSGPPPASGSDRPEALSIGLSGPAPLAPPISQVAGETATARALEDVTGELQRIRREGRLVLSLDLDSIDDGTLVRDRLVGGDEDMTALMQSLTSRGQQTPIEVMELSGGRYGLISGWRRLTALRRLQAETGEARFGRVQALLRRPDTASEAYVAMVEENEIRVGLSYYERARIAARATEQGVFETEKAALLALFSTASRAKRSKIRSFLRLYHSLDDTLRFAAAIPERLGLKLVKALEGNAGLAADLSRDLAAAAPQSAEEEARLLQQALEGAGRGRRLAGARGKPKTPPGESPTPVGIRISTDHVEGAKEITLCGPGVTESFEAALRTWLAGRSSA